MEMKMFLFLLTLGLCGYSVAMPETLSAQCNCAEVMVLTKEEMRREIHQQMTPVRSYPDNYSNRSTCACDALIFEKLDNLQKAVADINEMVEDIEANISAKIEQLLQPVIKKISALHRPGKSASHPALSCGEILDYDPNTPSGEYWIEAGDGTAVQRYCDMNFTCDGKASESGWMLISHLDMTESGSRCFQGLTQSTYSSKRLCGKRVSTGCSSVNFANNGIKYNQVCGKIKGYQFGSPDAFHRGSRGVIDSGYVDGVSLTHGYPRKHVWTFASSNTELRAAPGCSCTNVHKTYSNTRPSFVGNDHFCDAGSPHEWERRLYDDNPLWDAVGCGPANSCCSLNRPPWFFKQLPSYARDDIEMRVCSDQVHGDEDIFVETVDIYVH